MSKKYEATMAQRGFSDGVAYGHRHCGGLATEDDVADAIEAERIPAPCTVGDVYTDNFWVGVSRTLVEL